MLEAGFVEALVNILGRDNVLTGEEDLDRYSADALTPFRAFRAAAILEQTADVVVLSQSTQQVAEIVNLASTHRVPVVPYDGGTGVMGAALPVRGGVLVDMKRLNRVIQVNATDRTVMVEASTVLEDLARELKPHGLMPGHYPWSVPIATVGGAISTNGGYGATGLPATALWLTKCWVWRWRCPMAGYSPPALCPSTPRGPT